MLIRGDARAIPLVDRSVQCVVTSPPYFGLRDYGCVGQIGLEATPDAYVAVLVAVFREVRRVLTDDGVAWVNLGDSYATGTTAPRNPTTITGPEVQASWAGRSQPERCGTPRGWKTKDLLGMPWMVAFALRADGWYLRSDIIWSKPNPMPESVTDRPTKAHEYLFLLSKAERYFYDAAAIYEPYAASTLREVEDGYDGWGVKDYEAAGVQNPSDAKRRIIAGIRKRQAGRPGIDVNGGNQQKGFIPCEVTTAGRNRRSVWTIPTMPYYAGAHFATMPEALVEPCILAGSRLGDRVLDPFSGSGTVGAVAERLGRRWVGLDLNPAYHQLAKARTAQRGLKWGA